MCAPIIEPLFGTSIYRQHEHMSIPARTRYIFIFDIPLIGLLINAENRC
jgi:hypothetical protein